MRPRGTILQDCRVLRGALPMLSHEQTSKDLGQHSGSRPSVGAFAGRQPYPPWQYRDGTSCNMCFTSGGPKLHQLQHSLKHPANTNSIVATVASRICTEEKTTRAHSIPEVHSVLYPVCKSLTFSLPLPLLCVSASKQFCSYCALHSPGTV